MDRSITYRTIDDQEVTFVESPSNSGSAYLILPGGKIIKFNSYRTARYTKYNLAGSTVPELIWNYSEEGSKLIFLLRKLGINVGDRE